MKNDGALAVSLIVVAAGTSARMGSTQKKEYLPCGTGTVLSCAVEPFITTGLVKQLVIVVPESDTESHIERAKNALFASPVNRTYAEQKSGQNELHFVAGGNTRQKSVRNALEFLAARNHSATVLIHDGARPFVTADIILRVAENAAQYGAAAPYTVPVDTLKEIASDGNIVRHFDRSSLAAVQTPQGFSFDEIRLAHEKIANDGKSYTDDTEIYAAYVAPVRAVAGSPENRKITYAGDIPQTGSTTIRCGLGYDLHRLVSGRPLILGGVTLPFDKGEDGHSDGDVVLHAIIDSLLGASALGDIGSYFPPEDDAWKDANSGDLLKQVMRDVAEAGWCVCNIDCVIALEQPKFLPHRDAVRESIAEILGISATQVFIKAKTGEKIGKIGRGEAVEAWANCLLSRVKG